MQKLFFLELKNMLNIETNQCYNKIIETKLGMHIEGLKDSNSSIYEIREIVDIIFKLEKYEKYLDIEVREYKIILRFKL